MTTNNTLTTTTKSGLYKLGYITNANLNELNALLDETTLSFREISDIADRATIMHLNKYGYDHDRDGSPIPEQDAKFRYFETGFHDSTSETIIGVLERAKPNGPFVGMQWTTLTLLLEHIKNGNKFHFGEIYFDDENSAHAFLEDLAISAQPEDWVYQHRPSKIKYPILRSYLENILLVLKHEDELGEENRIIYSKDRKHMAFNTNLLDRYDHEVWVMMEARQMQSGKEMLINPKRVRSERELLFAGFERGIYPMPPTFYKYLEETHFQKDWEISQDFDAFEHIINDRYYRFSEEDQQLSPQDRARKLTDAIRFGVNMAKRNDHFVLPMYRPQKHEVQMLMPIYMNRIIGGTPDFALVLTLDKENKFYLPETILPLDEAYQDARLISILDGMWLTPKNV